MALFDCTISTETVVATAGTTNLATQTLVITPNAGHVVSAAAFTNNTAANNNINSITLSDTTTANAVGNKVNVVVDLKNGFAMPTSNTTITIDIDGRAILFSEKLRSVAGTWDSNTASNVTPTGSSGNAYSATGHTGASTALFTRVFTCASGKFFTTAPAIVITTGNASDYIITTTPSFTTVQGVAYHTSTMFVVGYTFPGGNASGDNIDFNISPAETIPVQSNIISSYDISTNAVPKYGESRVLRVYGTVGATFNCTVTNEDTHYYNFITFAFQSGTTNGSQTIGLAGYKDILISFPSVTDDDTYTITFTPTGTTTLGLTQTHPIVIQQLSQRTITYSTVSLATGARSYTALPSSTVSYATGEVTPSKQHRFVTLTITDDVPFRLMNTVNLAMHSPGTGDPLYAETNIGDNNTTESDVVFSKLSTSPSYSYQMTPINSVDFIIDAYDYWQGTTSSTVAFNVDQFINSPPTATPPGTTSIPNNTATTIQLAGTDPNGGSLVYTKVTNPTKGAVSIVSGTGLATYTPLGSSSSGADSFTYKVTDGHGADSPAATVNVTIASSGSGSNPTSSSVWKYNDSTQNSTFYTLSSPNIGTVTHSGLTIGSNQIQVSFVNWGISQTIVPSYVDHVGDARVSGGGAATIRYILKYNGAALTAVTASVVENSSNSVNNENWNIKSSTSTSLNIPANHNSGNGLISGANYTIEHEVRWENILQ